jgi:hypothetical protein
MLSGISGGQADLDGVVVTIQMLETGHTLLIVQEHAHGGEFDVHNGLGVVGTEHDIHEKIEVEVGFFLHAELTARSQLQLETQDGFT